VRSFEQDDFAVDEYDAVGRQGTESLGIHGRTQAGAPHQPTVDRVGAFATVVDRAPRHR
jgi:hypothetical protein